MNKISKGFAEIIIIITLAVVVTLGVGFYAYKNKQFKLTPQQQPTISLTPTPTDLSTDNSWKTYTSKDLGISFDYPSNFRVNESYQKGSGFYNEGIFIDVEQFGGMPDRWMKITRSDKSDYWDKQKIVAFYNLEVGQQYNKENLQYLGSFTRIPDVKIDNISTQVYISNNAWETPPPLYRYIIKKNDFYYFIDVTLSNLSNTDCTSPYPSCGIDHVKIFDQILSTFKFSGS